MTHQELSLQFVLRLRVHVVEVAQSGWLWTVNCKLDSVKGRSTSSSSQHVSANQMSLTVAVRMRSHDSAHGQKTTHICLVWSHCGAWTAVCVVLWFVYSSCVVAMCLNCHACNHLHLFLPTDRTRRSLRKQPSHCSRLTNELCLHRFIVGWRVATGNIMSTNLSSEKASSHFCQLCVLARVITWRWRGWATRGRVEPAGSFWVEASCSTDLQTRGQHTERWIQRTYSWKEQKHVSYKTS